MTALAPSRARRLLGPSFAPTELWLRQLLARPTTRYSQILTAIANLPRCEHVLEIGTWNGRNAINMVSMALRRNTTVRYTGFDLFEGLTDALLEREVSKRPPTLDAVTTELQIYRNEVRRSLRWRLHRRIFDFDLRRGFTTETLPAWIDQHPDYRAHLIFIDGGHALDTIENDWRWCSMLLAPDGVVFFDDYYENTGLAARAGCRQLVTRLATDPAWSVKVMPTVDIVPGMGGIRLARVARP